LRLRFRSPFADCSGERGRVVGVTLLVILHEELCLEYRRAGPQSSECQSFVLLRVQSAELI
jgi:hypothetical protein